MQALLSLLAVLRFLWRYGRTATVLLELIQELLTNMRKSGLTDSADAGQKELTTLLQEQPPKLVMLERLKKLHCDAALVCKMS